MGSYWLRIALGALAVFGIGMLITTIFRENRPGFQAVAQIPQVLATIPEHLDPLTLDGVQVGKVTRIQIDPVTDMTITVAAADSAAVQRIAACGALVGPIDDFFETGLACRSRDSLEGHGTFGDLNVAGTDVSVPLYAPADQVSEFHQDGHDAAVDIQADSLGETNVRITDGSGHDRVNIKADSGGATIEIRGDDGRPIFRLHADSQGVQLRSKDSQ